MDTPSRFRSQKRAQIARALASDFSGNQLSLEHLLVSSEDMSGVSNSAAACDSVSLASVSLSESSAFASSSAFANTRTDHTLTVEPASSAFDASVAEDCMASISHVTETDAFAADADAGADAGADANAAVATDDSLEQNAYAFEQLLQKMEVVADSLRDKG